MAANIFELIIKGEGTPGTSLTTYNVVIDNNNIHNWSYSTFYGLYLPENFSFSGELQALPETEYDTPLELFNEDFTEGFNDVYVNSFLEAIYSVRNSFLEAEGWDFNMYTLANDGLDAADTEEVEYDTAPSFSYYTEANHFTIPDLTIYGRKDSVSIDAERVGLIFKPRYINDSASSHPSQITDRMSEAYLASLHTAGFFALREDQRLNFGSLRSQNISTSLTNQAHNFVGAGEDRIIRVFENTYNLYSALTFGFDTTTNLYQQFFYENPNLLIGKKKFASIDSSNFPQYAFGVTCDYPLPATIISLENIFQTHAIGKNVELEIKLNATTGVSRPQELIGSYTDGVEEQNGDYNDIQDSAVLYSIDADSNLTGTEDGKWFAKPFLFNQAFDQDTFGAPLRADTETSNKTIFLGGQFSNAPFSVARVEKNLVKSTTYHVSFSVYQCNNGATARVYAIDSSNNIIGSLTDDITIPPKNALDPNSITHFTFDTHKAFNRVALEVTLLQDLPTASFIRISYVRFEQTTFSLSHQNIDYIRNLNTGVDEPQISPSNFSAFISNVGAAVDLPVIVTTSELKKYPLSYSKHKSSSPNYQEVKFYQDAFSPNLDIKSDVQNLILPFSKADGTFSASESQLVSDETGQIHLLGNSALTDDDGCYRADLYTTVRLNLIVGSKDLHIFADTNFGDLWASATININKIEFFDSEDSFITLNDLNENRIRFKYDPTNGVNPPNAVQREEIPETSIGSDVVIDYKVDSLTGGDSLMIDFGDGTDALEISSAGTSSGTINAGGSRLRIRTQTQGEKGSALTGLDAVIDYVKIKTQQTGTQVMVEQIGDPSSLNSSFPYVASYDSAMRVKNVDITNLTLAAGVANLICYISFDPSQIEGASSVKLIIDSGYISSGSEIKVSHAFAGSSGSTSITTSSLGSPTEIIIYNISESLNSPSANSIQLEFKTTDPADTLDVYLNNLTMTVTFEEASGGKSDVTLDLFNDFDISFNASVKDFRDLGSSSSSFSKTLTIPATSKNKLAFNFQNELNSLATKFYEKNPLRFILKADGINIFSGFANLISSSLDEIGTYELETNLVAGNANWVELLKDIDLKTLRSKNYIIREFYLKKGALQPSLKDEIFFPLVDNGKWNVRDSENPDAVNIGWGNIKAAFSIKLVLEAIFEQIGFTLKSDFFNEQTEYSGEFSFDFAPIMSRFAAIAPEMSKPDFYIQRTALDLSFDPSLVSGQYANVSQISAFGSISNPNAELGSRPFISGGSHLVSTSDGFNFGYYIDWAYIKFNVINQDVGGFHSYEDISATESLQGVQQQTQNYAASNEYKLKGNNLGVSKSFIEVSISGYYDLDVAVNFDLKTVDETLGFIQTDSGFLNESQSKTFLTVMLVAEDFASDDLYLNSNRLSFNAFDLLEESSVELLADGINTGYEQTRVSLSRVQYLEVGKKYNVVVMTGTRQVQPLSYLSENTFTHSFRVNELDFRMKLCKSPYAMEGKYSCVYGLEATPKVTYLDVLPDMKAIEFISEVTKCFNLIWSTNELTMEITVEPFSSFYDFDGSSFGFKDFTEKALITKISNNEVANSDIVYSMAEDSSDYFSKEGYQGDSSISFGDKKIYLNQQGILSNAKLSSENEVSLKLFASLSMGYAKFISRTTAGNPQSSDVLAQTDNLIKNPLWLPRIWSEPESTLEPSLPEQKPNANNSHQYKLCIIKGTKYTHEFFNDIETVTQLNDSPLSDVAPCIHYSIEERFRKDNNGNQGTFSGLFRYEEKASCAYLEVGSYFPFEPNTPSAIFSDIESSSGESSSLFNTYHQKLIDMIIMRDKIVTAEIYLTSEDVRSLNFRQLVKIDNELYIINKVKDFNFSGEPTEVELLLVTRTGTNYEIL